MQINELNIPSSIQDARYILKNHGYKVLGVGSFATVFAKPDDPWVLKLFSKYDTGYLKFINLSNTMKGNPHIPKFRGKLINVNDNYYAIRMEKLDPVALLTLTPEQKETIIKFFWLVDILHQRTHNADSFHGMYPIKKLKERMPKILELLKEQPKLLPTLKKIVKTGTSREFDLGDSNIMLRGDTIVITDP